MLRYVLMSYLLYLYLEYEINGIYADSTEVPVGVAAVCGEDSIGRIVVI